MKSVRDETATNWLAVRSASSGQRSVNMPVKGPFMFGKKTNRRTRQDGVMHNSRTSKTIWILLQLHVLFGFLLLYTNTQQWRG